MKFFQVIYKRLKHGKSVVVTVNFSGNGKNAVELFVVQQAKGKLDILDKQVLPDLNELVKHKEVNAGVPVYLHLSGNGVMVREFEYQVNQNNIEQFLPNFKLQEYFIQIDNLVNGKSVLAMVRKDLVDALLESKDLVNVCFSGVLIGPKPIITLANQLDTSGDTINVGGVNLLLSGGKISGIQRTESSTEGIFFMEEQRSIAECYALATAVLCALTPSGYALGYKRFVQGYKESMMALLTRVSLKFGLGIIFTLLLANYFVFENYYKEQELLNNQISSGQNMLTRITDLQKELKQKKKFISDNKLDDFYYLSYFSDQIGTITGNNIRLDEMSFNPVTKRIKPGQPILFEKGVVIVKGNTTDVESYRKFLADLKKMKWNKDVIFQDYEYIPGKKKATFQLHLQCDLSILQ
ncbi:hypothetical protein EYV94_27645 [Puteibacter caeruleilacunae]|nr:hypothetical protein EYV94_27645 [Puteibacter caeruleilacunae]